MSERFFATRTRRVAFEALRRTVAGFARVFWRVSVEGKDQIPAGPFILAPVHRSNIDGPLMCCVTRRPMLYLVKKEMWKHGWSAWFFDYFGGIAVDRGEPDRTALRRCQDVLAAGEPLVMFPEGTRQFGPLVENVFDGVAFVALRTGVPIVPVGIGGSEGAQPKGSKFVKPVKIHLVVGSPLLVAAPVAGERVKRSAVAELTEQLRGELQRVFDEAQAKARV
jgi:1-acyl-sn-glycerol-3-phosphate acyltransferase